MNSTQVRLSMSGVTKRYPGVVALDDVSFEAYAGEIHALVGGNGAGKSTLMAVASGAITPDEGSIEINGQRLARISPVAARDQGLAIAFQHPALLPDLTVAENLALSVPETKRPGFGDLHDWAQAKLEPMGMAISPTARVGSLSLAEKQAVEICGALACDPDVVIFDEPTEAFMNEETQRLFEQIRKLAANGVAVIYISHRLPDVMALADRFTVLRDGQVRGRFEAGEVTEQDIITAVAGRKVEALFPDKAVDLGETVLSVDIRSRDLDEIRLDVRRHEVVGLAGVEGNGQREFIRVLGGAGASTGSITVEGKPADVSSPGRARGAGIVLMPQERHIEGVATVHSVRENLTVAATGKTARAGVISRRAENRMVDTEIVDLGIKTASPEVAVSTLSGGNQQKVSLGRALLSDPTVLLCDEPTQGIDVGVRSDIYHRLRDNAERGIPVVVLSSDNVELAGLCDRVLVFSRGRVVAELVGDAISDHAITEASLTAGGEDHAIQSDEIRRKNGWLTRMLGSEQGPSAFLVAATLALIVVGAMDSDRFLSSFNISSSLALLAPLLFLAAGQLMVVMTGGIDLSVGPLTGTLVVIASFYVTADLGGGWWVLGLVLMALFAALVGVVNGSLVRFARVSPVVATLVTMTGLQGLSLVMRDTPGGTIAEPVTSALNATIGPVPWAVIVGAVLLVGLEWASRRTRIGLRLRAAGSDDVAAHKRGIPVTRVFMMAYIGCSLLTFLGALMLMAQIGVGDPTAGTSYTLVSVTAVVLGGASVFGGRGSFIGVLFGVFLVQVTQTTATFIGLSQAWQYWLPGLMALGACALFAQAQRRTS